MSNHLTEEEKEELDEIIYDCIVNKKMSIRQCAEYITNTKRKISHVTISSHLDSIKKNNGLRREKIDEVLSSHKPKTVKDNEEIRKRVRNVVVALQAGYNFEEIANMLNESFYTVYRDFTTRLNLLTSEELETLGITNEAIEQIKIDLQNRSLSNLKK